MSIDGPQPRATGLTPCPAACSCLAAHMSLSTFMPLCVAVTGAGGRGNLLWGRFPSFCQQLQPGQSFEECNPSRLYVLIFTAVTIGSVPVSIYFSLFLINLRDSVVSYSGDFHSITISVEINKNPSISTVFAIFRLIVYTYMFSKGRRHSQTTSPVSTLLHIPLSPCPLCTSSPKCPTISDSILPDKERSAHTMCLRVKLSVLLRICLQLF